MNTVLQLTTLEKFNVFGGVVCGCYDRTGGLISTVETIMRMQGCADWCCMDMAGASFEFANRITMNPTADCVGVTAFGGALNRPGRDINGCECVIS